MPETNKDPGDDRSIPNRVIHQAPATWFYFPILFGPKNKLHLAPRFNNSNSPVSNTDQRLSRSSSQSKRQVSLSKIIFTMVNTHWSPIDTSPLRESMGPFSVEFWQGSTRGMLISRFRSLVSKQHALTNRLDWTRAYIREGYPEMRKREFRRNERFVVRRPSQDLISLGSHG